MYDLTRARAQAVADEFGAPAVYDDAGGLCSRDMYCYLGKNPNVSYPQVRGHEIAGSVSALGDGVHAFQSGARVVVEPFIGCGVCYPCRVGKPTCCAQLRIIGVHRPGGFAEYLAAPAARVYPIPSGLSLSDASFAEPVAIGVQACRRGEVAEDEHGLVLGRGPIGLALIEVARARGARVVAADMLPARLETAARLGAETLPAGEGLLAAVLERTDGEGAPVVIEAMGNPAAMAQTVDLVASGGRVVIVGLVPRGVVVTFPGLDLTRKEMTILGSRVLVNCFPEALELLRSGAITCPRGATEISVWDAPGVFARLAEEPDAFHKVVLVREALDEAV